MDTETFLTRVEERVGRFRRLPGVHLPLYESHGGVDFGHYLCFVRTGRVWQESETPPDGDEMEAQALLAEHMACSVQDIEELLRTCNRLRLENKLLRIRLIDSSADLAFDGEEIM